MRYILASASPRRRELLSLFIKDFDIVPGDADESFNEMLKIDENLAVIALNKGKSSAGRLYPGGIPKYSVVISADTVVVLNGVPFGKPQNCDEALIMLEKLNGNTHTVMTAVHVLSREVSYGFISRTEVTFRQNPAGILKSYAASSEPLDKAGAYGIQGLGCILVEKISGDYNNVVGLPVSELVHSLIEHNLYSLQVC